MRRAAHAVLLLAVTGAAFLAGSWSSEHGVLRRPEAAHVRGAATDATGAPSAMAATVAVTAEQQQLIGVRVSAVERVSATHTLRLVGRVAADEGRVYRINAGIDGVVREVSGVTTGSHVEKDQRLATFSSPDAITAVQAYLVALNTIDRLRQDGAERAAHVSESSSNFQQRLEKLQNVGMSGRQIEEIKRTRQVPERIEIRAPADGFVLARNITREQKFDRGAEWYRIADLRRVWIVADVFEHEAHDVRPGLRARVSVPGGRRTIPATVAAALPEFDATTRALKVRLEADNPGHALRPDMIVDVDLTVAMPAAVAVPVDAVVDAGLTAAVFVERGEGRFEPRQVRIGWRAGGLVEIVSGLTQGERIVVSGTFLLDSESRMRLGARASSEAPGTAKPPHPGPDHRGHGAPTTNAAPARGPHAAHGTSAHAHAGHAR